MKKTSSILTIIIVSLILAVNTSQAAICTLKEPDIFIRTTHMAQVVSYGNHALHYDDKVILKHTRTNVCTLDANFTIDVAGFLFFESCRIDITSIDGKVVHTINIAEGQMILDIDLHHLTNGVYFIQDANRIFKSQKVIINK